MTRRSIRILGADDRYKYLWVKEIRGVDLSQHCARSFKGTWRDELSYAHDRWRDLGMRGPFGFELELHPARAYYACGVTDPYVWRKNAHLAFVPDDSTDWMQWSNQGLAVETRGLRRVLFGSSDIEGTDRNAGRKEYATCRNWQFAHWLKRQEPMQAGMFASDDGRDPEPPHVWGSSGFEG